MVWKVFKSRIKLFPHPNAERLVIGKVGKYQVVTLKGLYVDCEDVVFVPAKSVLPDELANDYREYLGGPEKNRVREVSLRGEVSMGMVFKVDEVTKNLPYKEDISELLGIYKYEPSIPVSLSGDVLKIPKGTFSQHDVERYNNDFRGDEEVSVTEKIHGSQVILGRSKEGEIFVTSKGLMSRGLSLVESDRNTYWRAARKWLDAISYFSPRHDVQFIGEVVPVQKGFSYGFDTPTILFFDVRVDGEGAARHTGLLWVPSIYNGPFSGAPLNPSGNEQVSGKEVHIKEGIVIKGENAIVKILNKKYKETGEEIS